MKGVNCGFTIKARGRVLHSNPNPKGFMIEARGRVLEFNQPLRVLLDVERDSSVD